MLTPHSPVCIVFGIDPDMFTDKKAPAYVVFDAQTGAIREIGTR